jgi:hypothetical protein
LRVALIAALLVGLNFYVICFGTVGLPFGFCLFFTTAAFRLTIATINRSNSRLAFLAGVCAAAAAASSLFTAPAAVVLWLWFMRHNRAGSRWLKGGAFLFGALLPLLPLMWLVAQAPQQTFFNLIGYHLLYRVETTNSPWRWNLRELVDWFVAYQGLVLLLLAGIGFWLVIKGKEFVQQQKSEFYLCAGLITVLSLVLAIPRPTFAFYFVLLTPFISILASLGFYAIVLRLRNFATTGMALGLIALYGLGLAGRVYQSRLEIFHADHNIIKTVANEVNQVTSDGAWIYAFEQVYFEAQRMPPPGLENAFNPFSKADEWLREGRFDTLCMMANDPRIKSFNLFERYAHHKVIPAHHFQLIIFWGKAD